MIKILSMVYFKNMTHGTSERNWNKIKIEGFRPTGDERSDLGIGVYFWPPLNSHLNGFREGEPDTQRALTWAKFQKLLNPVCIIANCKCKEDENSTL